MFSKPCEGRITSPFGMRTHPITGKPSTMHWGVDYGNSPTNNIIIAAAAGRVVRSRNAETDGYGKLVMIEHVLKGVLYTTVYAHLASISVKEGATVKQGQRIAVKGTTGNSTGIHLHFEVHRGKWNNKYTNARNPLHFIVDPEVFRLQTLLVKAGHKISADGVFGPATISAVKAFQKSAGLVVDGSAGPLTMSALEKATAPKPKPPEREVDEMAQQLPDTQKKDMKNLLAKAYKGKVFSVDHTSKVDKMTRGQAADLLISYVARTK